MKILVIRFSSMGDVILVTPLFSYLKEKFPDSSITFLTGSQYSELFKDDPRLASVAGFSKADLDSCVAILNQQWDLVIDLQNGSFSKQIIKKSSYRGQVHFFDKLHMERFLLLVARINQYKDDVNVALRYIRSFDKNATVAPSLKLYFNGKKDSQALSGIFLKNSIMRPQIALFPFSAWKNKEWPREYFIRVGHFFSSKGWNIIVMGGPSEADDASRISELIGPRCISLAGKISLYECGCALNSCALALGVDTGLSHLARACGVKTGIIFGPTTRHFGFFPSGAPRSATFEIPLRCRPCHAHGGNICLRGNEPCMRRILPETVIGGLMELSSGGSLND